MKQYHVKNMKQVFIVDDLPKVGFDLKIKATDEECALMAEALNIDKVASFRATLLISQWRRGGAHIVGEFETSITQSCVVSLEPFDSEVKETIDQKFFSSLKLPELNDKNEGEMIDNDMDPPDALEDGKLDVFDYLVETLLLHLDPYPRKPDGQLESLAIAGKFEINQPTMEDEQPIIDEDGSVSESKVKSKATHKPFADLAKLLKDK
ncbi:MAG: DUF177 domain-containing protein [Hyphomicrobiales bacterium]